MKSKNILIIVSVILILIGVKLTFLKPKNQGKPSGAGAMGKGMPSKVTAFIASASTLDNQLFSSGTVRANEEVMLMPEVAGKLIQINFKEGTNVSKGSLLAKISDVDLQAQLSKLNLQLKLARERETRLKSMIEIKGVSQEEFDAATNLVNTINADIEFNKAQIAKTEIRAPFDGQIGLRKVSEGGFVNSSTVIASIQQTKILKIDFTVPEKYADIVVPGNIVKFRVDNTNETFTAKVDAIEPKIDEQTRNITIRAIFNNDGGKIYPGAFARIELSANKKQEAILIPTEAIVPELKGKKVFVNRSGKAIPVKVKTGLRNDAQIEITEGLKVGDTVITTGIMTLKPEAEIIITNLKKIAGMNISSISINRPVLAIVMNIIIILFGAIGYSFLGVREFPSIDPPIITVKTNYAGANADVIESQITEPLEKAINGIDGVRTISSASNQGSSVITVEFNLSSNLEAAANDVRDKVSQAVNQLPKDMDGLPTVTKSDANSEAILSMTLQSNTRTQLEVSDYAENVLAERLQTIPGVSTIQIWGQKKYAMRLSLNPVKLSSYGLTPQDVKAALDRENVELPSGKISGNTSELTLKTVGRLKTPEEFNNLVLKIQGDQTVKLKDIGEAYLGPENEETMLKQSGVPMIGMAIVPQPGANYLEIADEFYKRLEKIKKDLPKDFYVNMALDNTLFIKKSITEVIETLAIAIVLVIIIIYLFFRDWLIALRPLVDIPVSLIGAFFIMYMMGYSINVLTLLAIVLATGLVVDDGIVVTENIYKKIEDGLSPMEAAHKGSKEIYFAVISTSITLAAVFMPVIFLEGFVGRLFREFGVVLAGAVLISAFVSLTLTPMLNARLVKKNPGKSKFYIATEPFFERMISSYGSSLQGFLKKRVWSIVILFGSIGIIYFAGGALQSELSPLEDRNWMRVSLTGPEGASYEYTDNFVNEFTKFVLDSVPEKRVCLTVTAPGFVGSGSVNSAFVRLALVDASDRKRSQQQIADMITKESKNFPQGKVFVIQQQTISAGGMRGGLPVQFVLQAPNFEKLKDKLPKFMDEVQKSPIFQGFDTDLKFNKPEISITVDREKAKNLGISVADIAQTLQLALSGQRFNYFTMNGKQYQVIGQFSRENRDEVLDIKSIYLRNNVGKLIQLDNIVSFQEESSPPQLYHYNRYQSATVSAGLAPGKTISDGIKEMERIASVVLDDSFSTSLTGASRDFSESSSNILFAFMLALLIVYLVLAAQFESFRDPFVIMLTVPLALAGALLSLWYFNQTLNIFSQIGIIMLIGLVTKNGILIVEFANQLKEKGMLVKDAIQAAAEARLRPILMTSLATALGALPIALALGAGAKSRMGMGVVIVGGILFSLILTLFVIPAIYTYLSKEHKEHA